MVQDEDIEVLIDEEEPRPGEKKKPEDDIQVEVTDKPEDKPKSADEGIEELKKTLETRQAKEIELQTQLETERRGRLAAEKAAKEADAHAVRFRSEADRARYGELINGLESATNAVTAAKREFRQAYEAGDADKMAEAQEHIGRAASRAGQFEDAKADFEARLKRTGEAEKEPPKRQQAGDPVEDFASQLTPRAGTWIRQHPECVTNQGKQNKMFAAHYAALSQGLSEGSDEYFTMLDQELGYAEKPKPSGGDATGGRSAPRRPSAPPSREPADNPRTVRLTPAEVEIASNMGMSNKEYAIHKAALIKEGKIGAVERR